MKVTVYKGSRGSCAAVVHREVDLDSAGMRVGVFYDRDPGTSNGRESSWGGEMGFFDCGMEEFQIFNGFANIWYGNKQVDITEIR